MSTAEAHIPPIITGEGAAAAPPEPVDGVTLPVPEEIGYTDAQVTMLRVLLGHEGKDYDLNAFDKDLTSFYKGNVSPNRLERLAGIFEFVWKLSDDPWSRDCFSRELTEDGRITNFRLDSKADAEVLPREEKVFANEVQTAAERVEGPSAPQSTIEVPPKTPRIRATRELVQSDEFLPSEQPVVDFLEGHEGSDVPSRVLYGLIAANTMGAKAAILANLRRKMQAHPRYAGRLDQGWNEGQSTYTLRAAELDAHATDAEPAERTIDTTDPDQAVIHPAETVTEMPSNSIDIADSLARNAALARVAELLKSRMEVLVSESPKASEAPGAPEECISTELPAYNPGGYSARERIIVDYVLGHPDVEFMPIDLYGLIEAASRKAKSVALAILATKLEADAQFEGRFVRRRNLNKAFYSMRTISKDECTEQIVADETVEAQAQVDVEEAYAPATEPADSHAHGLEQEHRDTALASVTALLKSRMEQMRSTIETADDSEAHDEVGIEDVEENFTDESAEVADVDDEANDESDPNPATTLGGGAVQAIGKGRELVLSERGHEEMVLYGGVPLEISDLATCAIRIVAQYPESISYAALHQNLEEETGEDIGIRAMGDVLEEINRAFRVHGEHVWHDGFIDASGLRERRLRLSQPLLTGMVA